MSQITILLLFRLFGLYSCKEYYFKHTEYYINTKWLSSDIHSSCTGKYNVDDNITICRPYKQSYDNADTFPYEIHYIWEAVKKTMKSWIMKSILIGLFCFPLIDSFASLFTGTISFTQDQMNMLIYQDCLECFKINDTHITLNSIHVLSHIFETVKIPTLNLNDIEYNIIFKLISFIVSEESIQKLKYESTVCLLNFAYIYANINDDNIPHIMPSESNIDYIWIQCIDKIIYNHTVEESLVNYIVIQLQRFADPCQSNELLLRLSMFYRNLCEEYDLVTEWTIDTKLLLWQINTLLLFEENNEILSNILRCYDSDIIFTHENDDGDLELMDLESFTDKDCAMELKNKYITKQHRNILLFDGFVLESRNIYIPNDIIYLMFKYFNCYECIETNLIHRLITLMSKKNEYSIDISNAALDIMNSITCWANRNVTNDLLFNYDIMSVLKQLLMDNDDKIDAKCLYWTVYNIGRNNFQSLRNNNIFRLMFNRFEYDILRNNDFIDPWCTIIEEFGYELQTIIDEYEVVKMLCVSMGNILKINRVKSANAEMDIDEKGLGQILAFIGYLLDSDYNRDICIVEIKKHDGINMLEEIKNEFKILTWDAEDILLDITTT